MTGGRIDGDLAKQLSLFPMDTFFWSTFYHTDVIASELQERGGRDIAFEFIPKLFHWIDGQVSSTHIVQVRKYVYDYNSMSTSHRKTSIRSSHINILIT